MKYITLLILLLVEFNLSAQDKIYYKSGKRVEAKVTKVTSETIFYKKFSNPNGPDYEVRISEIDLIVYENGEHEVYSGSSSSSSSSSSSGRMVGRTPYGPRGTKRPSGERILDFNKNLVSINYLDLIFMNFSLSYERIIDDNGYLGLRAPLSIGFSTGSDLYLNNNILSAGLDINFYPGGQRRTSYFCGPGFRAGNLKRIEMQSFFDPNTQLWTNEVIESIHNNYGVYFNNGFLFQPTKSFNVSIMFGMGLKEITGIQNLTPSVIGEANAVFRF